MDKLNKLKKILDEQVELLDYKFWECEERPHIFYDEIRIQHIFYDEAFMFEVNPLEYYNLNNNDLEKFFKYYNI